MNNKKIIKKVLTITVLGLFLFLPYYKVQALDIVNAESIALDTSIQKDNVNTNYSLPSKIIVVPIFLPTIDLKINDQQWYKGIFYYTVQRLGFNNIPYHYIVSSSGNIYSNNSADERKIPVQDLGNNNIIVGYLANNQSNNFDPRSVITLKNLLLDICNRNAINPNNIFTNSIQFKRDETSRTVTLKSQQVFGNWNIGLKSIVDSLKTGYNPVQKSYKLQISALNLPADSVNPAQELSGSITIKNVSNYTIYGGGDSAVILTKKDGGKSLFYLNNTWISQSQIALMTESDIILPGKEQTFKFKFKSPLYIGNINETFILQTLSGRNIDADNIQLKVNIKRGSQRIVLINNTELNYVKAHSTPSTVSPEVGRVESGGRFLVLEEDSSGFIKIDLNDGKTGWIAGWLTSTI